MTFLRLIVATCLWQMVVAKPSLRNSLSEDFDHNIFTKHSDPTISETTIASAIADSKTHYENLQNAYIKEGCLESWGKFPSASSLSTEAVPDVSRDFSSACKCGLLHDSAASIVRLDQESAMIKASEAAGTSLDIAFKEVSTSHLDEWVMARTPHQQVACSGGRAGGYSCSNVDLVAHVPLNSLMVPDNYGHPQQASDVWGWTSNDGSNREFVIWGTMEGYYFFEVMGMMAPKVVGFLPSSTKNGNWREENLSSWRDIKVVGDFVFMGSEAANHGMLIFDMRELLVEKDCENDKYCRLLSYDHLYEGNLQFQARNSHNIVANEDSKFVYMVGGTVGCDGGLHVVNVANPLQPTTAGCFGDDGYVHDAQCVMYKGPDSRFKNNEICFSFNGNTVTIVDVTDKHNMEILSRTSYNGVAYTHQGWLSSDHTHIVFGDELDEYNEGYYNKKVQTRTLVMNVKDLKNPTNFREYLGSTEAIDHNQYVVKATAEGQGYDPFWYDETDLIFQSNYNGGLRILQVLDYETANFEEVGYFDIMPYSNSPTFEGAWSVFPYFKSGLVAISGSQQGLFLVKPRLQNSLVKPPNKPEWKPAPTPEPTPKPTAEPTPKPTLCEDIETPHTRKNCRWVGKAKPNKTARKNQRLTRKRCNKKLNGEFLWTWCLNTCGMVGIGDCDHLDSRVGKR